MANIFDYIASGKDAKQADGLPFPIFREGVHSAEISEAIVASHRAGGVWTRL